MPEMYVNLTRQEYSELKRILRAQKDCEDLKFLRDFKKKFDSEYVPLMQKMNSRDYNINEDDRELLGGGAVSGSAVLGVASYNPHGLKHAWPNTARVLHALATEGLYK